MKFGNFSFKNKGRKLYIRVFVSVTLCIILGFLFSPNLKSFAEMVAMKSPLDWSISSLKKDQYFANQATKSKGVFVNMINAEEVDSAVALSSDSISESRFYIRVSNNTENNLDLLSLSTGIKEGTLNYIRVEGATGFVFENGILILKYFSLASGESADISVTGLPLISAEDISLNMEPKVFDKNSQLVASGEKNIREVKGKDPVLLNRFNFANVFKKDTAPKDEKKIEAEIKAEQ